MQYNRLSTKNMGTKTVKRISNFYSSLPISWGLALLIIGLIFPFHHRVRRHLIFGTVKAKTADGVGVWN